MIIFCLKSNEFEMNVWILVKIMSCFIDVRVVSLKKKIFCTILPIKVFDLFFRRLSFSIRKETVHIPN